MLHKLKYYLIGSPLPNQMMAEKRLNKIRALAAFSPDALSSLAYANQEIYLALVIAGTAGLSLQFPIALAITLLLVIVALSYTQVVRGYPGGGGSYIVARENLGLYPGLVTAGALLLDYILTAAVSLTAGVAAISSAFPQLWVHRVWIALGLLAIITLLNMRGIRESGTAMAIPVYLFLITFIGMLIFGILQAILQGSPTPFIEVSPVAANPLGWFLILHAFAAGCTALTGIEAISDGVAAFQEPTWVNARKTLIVMTLFMAFLFLGSMGLTQFFGVIAGPNETILSALTRRLLGNNPFYYLVQFSTLAVLAVAANTSFGGFPRITAILAQDKFMPRQLFNLGDRLVFHNGILLLSGLTALLIIAFNGNSHLLIPLFAVGAFTAFTLSQAGMVMRWYKSKERGWQFKAIINGLGAVVTGTTLVIISASKFIQGAWISLVIIPLIVVSFLKIRSHYISVGKQLSLHGLPPSLKHLPKPRIVIPVSGVHRGMVDAVNFARSISDNVTALFINVDPGPAEKEIRKQWNDWFPDVELVVVVSPYRSLVEPLLSFLDKTDDEHNDGRRAVLILPEIIPASSWHEILHNQSAEEIKKAVLFRRREFGLERIIIDVPYHLKE